MINPTEGDIGRKVVFQNLAAKVEEGVITSFNTHYVFVRYGADYTSQATHRENLAWAFPSAHPQADLADVEQKERT